MGTQSDRKPRLMTDNDGYEAGDAFMYGNARGLHRSIGATSFPAGGLFISRVACYV